MSRVPALRRIRLRHVAAVLLVALLIASALDPAEAIRSVVRNWFVVPEAQAEPLAAEPSPAIAKLPEASEPRPSTSQPDADVVLWTSGDDLGFWSADARMALAEDMQMTEALNWRMPDSPAPRQFGPVATPEPGGWLFLGLGALALLSRVWRGRSSSGR